MSVVESSFAIIAEPNRRAILSLLLSSELSVGEIERELRLRSDSGFPSASDTCAMCFHEKIITIGYFRAYTPTETLL
jgi:DNA-binding transcriptional ArsR family regulator